MRRRNNRNGMNEIIQDNQPLEITNIGDREWIFPDQDTSDEIYELFEAALDLIEELKFGSAKAKLKKMLKLNPDHIDAIHHLAIIENRKKNKDLSRKLWERGVEIGRSAIPKRFKRGSSRIPWSNLDNRPFLRCLHGHAFALHDDGRIEEAFEVFQEIIDYNPDDDQDVRDILMEMCLEEDRYSDAVELANRFKDDPSPEIIYGKVIALFLNGLKVEAEKELKDAVSFKPKVALELMKKRHPKPESLMQGYFKPGDWDEAYYYWESQGDLWTLEAIEWLKQNIPAGIEEEVSNGE